MSNVLEYTRLVTSKASIGDCVVYSEEVIPSTKIGIIINVNFSDDHESIIYTVIGIDDRDLVTEATVYEEDIRQVIPLGIYRKLENSLLGINDKVGDLIEFYLPDEYTFDESEFDKEELASIDITLIKRNSRKMVGRITRIDDRTFDAIVCITAKRKICNDKSTEYVEDKINITLLKIDRLLIRRWYNG